MSDRLLEVRDLSVTFGAGANAVEAVKRVSFDIERGEISMVSVLFQLDQHDFAVRNRLTLAEHRYNLDVPSWQERGPSTNYDRESIAGEIAASVR